MITSENSQHYCMESDGEKYLTLNNKFLHTFPIANNSMHVILPLFFVAF